MNRYSFECDAEYETAVNRFAPVATMTVAQAHAILNDEEWDNCKCGTRNEKHCPEHWL